MLKSAMLAVIALLAATPALAQEAGTPPGQEPAVNDPAVKPSARTLPVITKGKGLFRAFGEKPGLVALMDDAMERWLKNPRTRPFFENSDQARIKMLLVEQFCVIMNGGCTYSGRSMAEAHRGMNVNEGAFYALVEELQVAMNKRGIPFRAQNRLISALAPQSRDIIDR
ncbi:group 1 truncated hemoglobin [Sphingomonas sp.]|uniref:group I truncated hemoglobin n=1 Tax=Sphingomonas sp. TaxID=28214 RepID=UPI001D3939BA|nr:group 1 truncated hemoglobin [Sphingomonas sp.]MBX9795678.1 group 1 truncated hemoglobin [Sphingomonas sp.]